MDNRKGTILAGSFVQVNLTLKSRPAVEIPAAALIMKADKPFVAVVTPDRKVNFRTGYLWTAMPDGTAPVRD